MYILHLINLAKVESFLFLGVNVRGAQNFPVSWGRNFVLDAIGKVLINIKQKDCI